MKPDHYQTLGVAPTSEDVVVRAAYRALIRRYHPDANGSAEAAERARAINAAYAVLGDPDRRADYDAYRAYGEMAPPRPNRTGPIATGLISAVALGLLVFAILSPPGTVEELDEAAAAQSVQAPAPQQSAPPPPESIAAATPAIDLVPDPVRSADVEELPEMPVAQAPPPEIRAAAVAPPRQAQPVRSREQSPAAEPAAVAPGAASTPAAAAAKPSFDCRFAAGAAEQAVCRDSNLALLDDRMAVLYSQSWGQADEAKRAVLLETRTGFVERRDRCGSDSCIADAYLKRMREISDIMGGRGQPR